MTGLWSPSFLEGSPSHTYDPCEDCGQNVAAQLTPLGGKVLLHRLTLLCLPAGGPGVGGSRCAMSGDPAVSSPAP